MFDCVGEQRVHQVDHIWFISLQRDLSEGVAGATVCRFSW